METYPSFSKRELLWETSINELYLWVDRVMDSKGIKRDVTANEIKDKFEWDEKQGRHVLKNGRKNR
jgi:hypothetical protein